MKWKLFLIFAILVAGGGAGYYYNSRQADAGTQGYIREVTAKDLLQHIKDQNSPLVLVNFWASWCEPCKDEIPILIALHEEYGERGFMVLGATVDDLPRDSRAFVEEMEIPYPSVITTPRMREAWRLAPWLPTTFLIVDGRIVEEWIGPQARDVFEYSIRVGLGLAPALEDVIRTDARS
jgi:thiol-disulfide isomerase/thioredoxin